MNTSEFKSFIDRVFTLAREQDITEIEELEQLIFDEFDNELSDEWDTSW